MHLFQSLIKTGNEQITVLTDRNTGLRALVCIHDSRLGPALAPVHVWPYAADGDAWADSLNRAHGLSLKLALAGTDLGGGAITIVGDPEEATQEAPMRVLGRHIDQHDGRIIVTAPSEPHGTLLGWLRRETPHVLAQSDDKAAEWTALGTWHGIRSCLAAALGHQDYSKASYAVQGAGQAGHRLVRLLRATGARVWVSDLNDARTEALVAATGAEAVPMQQIYDLPATVFCPCAMSGVLNEDTLPRLKAKIVAGTANQPLQSEQSATQLASRGILYAPDFAINSGDLIGLSLQRDASPDLNVEKQISRIAQTLEQIFTRASQQNILPSVAATALAAERVARLHAAVPAVGRRRH